MIGPILPARTGRRVPARCNRHRIGRETWTRRVIDSATRALVPGQAGAVCYVQAVRSAAALPTAVVSASATYEAADPAGIADLFEARIDGVGVEQRDAAGGPASDADRAAANLMGVDPGAGAVCGDALGVGARRLAGSAFMGDRVGVAGLLPAPRGSGGVVVELAELLPGLADRA